MTITVNANRNTFRRFDLVKAVQYGGEQLVVRVKRYHGTLDVTLIPNKKFKYKLLYRLWRLWLRIRYAF